MLAQLETRSLLIEIYSEYGALTIEQYVSTFKDRGHDTNFFSVFMGLQQLVQAKILPRHCYSDTTSPKQGNLKIDALTRIEIDALFEILRDAKNKNLSLSFKEMAEATLLKSKSSRDLASMETKIRLIVAPIEFT